LECTAGHPRRLPAAFRQRVRAADYFGPESSRPDFFLQFERSSFVADPNGMATSANGHGYTTFAAPALSQIQVPSMENLTITNNVGFSNADARNFANARTVRGTTTITNNRTP